MSEDPASLFRHVLGKSGSCDDSYTGVPITGSVHDNHFCSANPSFIAIVTESVGGGSFLVLPINQTGRVDPRHPRVSGHSGPVLDVKWNPFDDHCVASCSEDCTVRIWDIPDCGVQQELLRARKTLIGHCRRVGLIQWHPTAENLLLSSAYDYRVRLVLMPVHRRHPSEALLLSVSFSGDGSRLAAASKDRRVRILDPRTGRVLHRVYKVLYMGGLRMLVRFVEPDFCVQEDLSKPLHEEILDASAGVIFPFYDADTRMLYLAGKGDTTIRCYELSNETPYISFLTEFRCRVPQKGLGVMPKRGLDVSACEIFRFYRVIAVKATVEPLSVVVPRRESRTFQKDLYPATAGDRAAVTAQEWLQGAEKGARHEPSFCVHLRPNVSELLGWQPDGTGSFSLLRLQPSEAAVPPSGSEVRASRDL
uniref:Coronin n=1 Tax=Gouania willdenowi TaxID=441366 RepID=A0A8C5HMU1_GOUWI